MKSQVAEGCAVDDDDVTAAMRRTRRILATAVDVRLLPAQSIAILGYVIVFSVIFLTGNKINNSKDFELVSSQIQKSDGAKPHSRSCSYRPSGGQHLLRQDDAVPFA
jgi:hypothetical protein